VKKYQTHSISIKHKVKKYKRQSINHMDIGVHMFGYGGCECVYVIYIYPMLSNRKESTVRVLPRSSEHRLPERGNGDNLLWHVVEVVGLRGEASEFESRFWQTG